MRAGTLRKVPRRIRLRVISAKKRSTKPRGPGGGEVEVKPRMLDHPRLHGRMLVRAVVVQDEMDVPLAGGLPIDLVQEGEEFGVRVARLARFDHMPLQDIEGGEQRRRSVARVIVGLARRQPGRKGRIGWVRSRAWI